MKLAGLGGISGSGKTSLVSGLIKVMPAGMISVLSFDNYYRPLHQQQKDINGRENFDLPGGVDDEKFLRDLERLKSGNPVEINQYHFNNPAAKPVVLRIEPSDILLVEGIFIYHFTSVRSLLDTSVFIEVPQQLTYERRLKRDMEERGYAEGETAYQWEHHVLPGYEQYLLPYRSSASLILDNSGDLQKSVTTLKQHLLAVFDLKTGD